MPSAPQVRPTQHKLTWKEGLFLVGPDPLTSPYYSSGALIVAGAGYATPAFQIGLYAMLFALAPLYIEAVMLTLSNGGTYVMTRYALSHLGKIALAAAALVGVVISFSYVATAIVSLLSYGQYVVSLVDHFAHGTTVAAISLSAIPALAFGIWVMPDQWRTTALTVGITTGAAIALSAVFPLGVMVMLAPLTMLYRLNNYGLKESVKVSRVIFLINLVVMGITILLGLAWVATHEVDLSRFVGGVGGLVPDESHHTGVGGLAHELGGSLPGFATLGAAMIPAALGSSILGASGVESVMNIPEELERPRRDVRRIYMWMLSTLMVVGGSLSILVFIVLPPQTLLAAHGSLLAELGLTVVSDVTGSTTLGHLWNIVIVANAALMLLGATNTGFAGARGLWVTMARDNLLPRLVLEPNARGSFSRINTLMLIAIFVLCWEGGADMSLLERWYGATFGLVMVSGVVAFLLLRRFKGDDRRIYAAPWNVRVGAMRVPVAAFAGLAFLGFALIGLYDGYAAQIRDLRTLLVTVGVLVGLVLLSYNHRPLMRAAYRYFRRVIETVEGETIESADRTIVVAVGGVRMSHLIRQAIDLARAQSRTTGIPYRQIVVFHMTRQVRREYVYRVTRDSLRPAGIEGNVVRIHTELTELATADFNLFLAVVPMAGEGTDRLHMAMDALVGFHERHGFHGHIVMIGDYGVTEQDQRELQERLKPSTLVTVPS